MSNPEEATVPAAETSAEVEPKAVKKAPGKAPAKPKEPKKVPAKAKTPEPAAEKVPKVQPEGKPMGRPNKFAGKKITKLCEGNPYREGSARSETFKLIRQGMSFEKFVEAGGTRIDLFHGVRKGHLSVD